MSTTELIHMTKSTWVGILDAYRGLSGSTENIKASQLASLLTEWGMGRISTSSATAAATDIIKGKTAYVNGSLVSGTIVDQRAVESFNVTAFAVSQDDETNTLRFTMKTNGVDWVVQDPILKLNYSDILGAGSISAGDLRAGVTFLGLRGTYVGTISTDTSDATATAAHILTGKTAYTADGLVNGGMLYFNNRLNNFTITGSGTEGSIGLSYTADLLTAIPAASTATTLGTVTDANFLASNIRSGVTIFGLEGSYAGSGGIDTSDATAVASNILQGKTAYVNGVKITGTMTDQRGEVWYYVDEDVGSACLSCDDNYFYLTPEYLAAVSSSTQFAVANNLMASALNLTSDKLINGYQLFGITGTGGSGSGINTNDATAVAADILYGKTAYANGKKITGTLNDRREGVWYYSDEDTNGAEVSGDTEWFYFVPVHEAVVGSNMKFAIANDIMTEAFGVTSDKLVKGYELFGVTGTYTQTSTPATATYIKAGLIAFANGVQITGTLMSRESSSWEIPDSDTSPRVLYEDGYLVVKTSERAIIDEETTLKYNQATVASAIGLTSNKIATGNTVLGIIGTGGIGGGTDTSDATATAEDILEGETAYVNGMKIRGTVTNYIGTPWLYIDQQTSPDYLSLDTANGYFCLRPSVRAMVDAATTFQVSYSILADVIGLTADRLVKGTSILGITGAVIPYIDSDLTLSWTGSSGQIQIDYRSSTPVYLLNSVLDTLGTISDTNFVASNIKAGATVFGLAGTYTQWKGDYESDYVYSIDDIVKYNGNVYKCIVLPPNGGTPDNESYWTMLNDGSPVYTPITFILDEATYQGETGMTWAEWCESSYNTGGYYCDTYVCTVDGIYCIRNVTPYSTIEANASYSTTSEESMGKVTFTNNGSAKGWSGTRPFELNMTWEQFAGSGYNIDDSGNIIIKPKTQYVVVENSQGEALLDRNDDNQQNYSNFITNGETYYWEAY